MAVKFRGELLDVTDQVSLTVQFKDNMGVPTDTDSIPTISIVQPNGLVLLNSTSTGVTKIGTGKYSYLFEIPYNGPYGVWNDIWVGYVNGYRIESTFSFVVNYTNTPAINTDGYAHLGDDPGFDYSQAAIKNINKLLKLLRARLNSSGKSLKSDSFGNKLYVTCDIFSVDVLVTFLAGALWEFNQIPHFTAFKFDDDAFIDQFGEILVEFAALWAMASKALIERGREYQITDNGISFQPPTVSELLNTQYGTGLTHYWEKIKFIKNSLKPNPVGLGVFGLTSGINPAFARLRHLRARRII